MPFTRRSGSVISRKRARDLEQAQREEEKNIDIIKFFLEYFSFRKYSILEIKNNTRESELHV
jgi:hypothetical protein